MNLPELDKETAGKVLKADLANILAKAKAGRPLSKYERTTISESVNLNEPRKKKTAAAFPKFVAGMESLGALISRQFPNIGLEISRQLIQKWRRLENVPEGCNEPFPAPLSSNRYRVTDCFAWVETYFPDGAPRGALAAKQKTRDAIDERKLYLLDIECKKADGALIERERARMTRRDALARQNSIMQTQIERVGPQLRADWMKQLNATPEMIAEFQRRDAELSAQIISAIYAEYQSQSRLEPEEKLAEEMKQKTVKA